MEPVQEDVPAMEVQEKKDEITTGDEGDKIAVEVGLEIESTAGTGENKNEGGEAGEANKGGEAGGANEGVEEGAEVVQDEETAEGEGKEELEGEGLAENEDKAKGEEKDKLEEGAKEETGEEVQGEEVQGEELGAEGLEEQEEHVELPPPVVEEKVEEEEVYVEEPPPDPAAPYDLSDSKEALRDPFTLRPDQLAEVEQLWALYQDYCPAYTDIDNYITEKELVHMLKCLMLTPYTPEQLQELIEYCVRPPHPKGHINFDQFLKMVTLRQRDFPVEEELRSALLVLGPDKTGTIDREYFKEVLAKQGNKLTQKQLDNLVKEVDISNDGTIGIEDVVGTMCIDLNTEDIQMLLSTLNPQEHVPEPDDY